MFFGFVEVRLLFKEVDFMPLGLPGRPQDLRF